MYLPALKTQDEGKMELCGVANNSNPKARENKLNKMAHSRFA
jgi:hypothetical protein